MPQSLPINYAGGLDRRYRRSLMAFFIRRTRDAAEAEDLTQEVFLRLLRAKNLDEMEQPDGYVFTIAANLFKDRGRTTSARQAARAAWVNPAAAATDPNLIEDRAPDRVLLGRESVAMVVEALSGLPDRTRDIFVLFRLEAMTQRQIAERFGISVSAVEKHVARALARITERVGER